MSLTTSTTSTSSSCSRTCEQSKSSINSSLFQFLWWKSFDSNYETLNSNLGKFGVIFRNRNRDRRFSCWWTSTHLEMLIHRNWRLGEDCSASWR
jgi:hypothetical protein